MSTYWQTYGARRLTRRRVLAGATGSAAGIAALLLAGCGGGDSGGGGGQAQGTGLLSKAEDTSSKATKGGILPSVSTSDTPGFTLYPSASSFVNFQNDRVYSKLFTGSVANRAKGEPILSTVEPDIGSSLEVSGDGLQITMKLRQGVLFDPRPPTSGRAANIEDVRFTWNLYKSLHRSRGQVSREANPNAPVESMTFPDSSTMVMKLAYPSPSLLPSLAANLNALYVYPVEADGKYDPAKEMRGSGPWMLDRYEPSVVFQYKRNPGFYRKDIPYLDGFDMPIVNEYATQLAQFRAGRIATFGVRSEDVVQQKKDFPDLVMQAADFGFDLGACLWFDFRPNKGSPFFDDRVRQALSLTFDRDLYIEAADNTVVYEREGIPVEKRWNSHVPLGEQEFWLDPQGKDFGENAKYFKRDLTEATKLVKAATGKDKVETAWTKVQGNDYGTAYHQWSEILMGMANEGPFKFNTVGVDYNTYFIRFISATASMTGGHEFDGVAFGRIAAFPEVDSWFGNHLIPGGTFFKFEENYPPANDRFYQLLKAQQVEQDRKKRLDMVREWQRYAAQKMFIIPQPGKASSFTLAWPWLGNFGVFANRDATNNVYYWLDKSKMKT